MKLNAQGFKDLYLLHTKLSSAENKILHVAQPFNGDFDWDTLTGKGIKKLN